MLNLNYYHLFYILLLLVGCQPSTNTQTKVFKITKATYNGKPVIGDRNSLSDIFSKPAIRLDSCSHTRIGHVQGYWVYDCITPEDDKSVTYLTYEDVVFLGKINFSSPSVKIITPDLTLSNQTTLEEIVTLFPNSYPQIYKDQPDLDKKILKQAYLSDDLPVEMRLGANQMELLFENNHLSSLTYFWKPEMTVAQLSKAREIERQVKEREK